MTKTIIAGCLLAGVLATVPKASAIGDLTLPGVPGYERSATLGSATDGAFGTGNATVTDVNAAFGAMAPWTEVGEAAGNSGTGSLTVSLTSGSWGAAPAAGTWTINDASFWTSYADAAISMHVGNGGGNPDHFIWLIEHGQTSGTWSYSNAGGGGGLSNLKLYSSGTGTSVPDAGATMVLLGAGLLGVGALRRRLSK